MGYVRNVGIQTAVAAAAMVFCGLLLAGCDEHVTADRNPEVRIAKHATWAWRPAQEAARARDSRDSRAVISRDVISRNESVVRETDATNEIVRGQIRVAIEQNMASKGFRHVNDPQAADFLVDYHVAVRRHTATVERVYGGGYPGVVCGPFRCWESWGWGPPEIGYQNIRFREGTIVFDFVQQSTNKLAFRAIGEKPVYYNRTTFTQGEVNGLVHHLLKDLKPGR